MDGPRPTLWTSDDPVMSPPDRRRPSPAKQLALFVEHLPPKIRRDMPRTWGECQEREAERMRSLIRSWLPLRPATCEHTRCPHNLLADFPNAAAYDGEVCVLRLSWRERDTEEIAERLGVSNALIKKVVAGAAARARRMAPDARDALEQNDHSPERRILDALSECGPMTWTEIRAELGLGGDEAERIRELMRGMESRGEVRREPGTDPAVFEIGER